MALKVTFAKSPVGIPVTDCYVRVESIQWTAVEKSVKAIISFYANQATRQNDVREKRKALELELEALKAERVALEKQRKKDKPDDKLEKQIGQLLQAQIDKNTEVESVVGDTPFFYKLFEFPKSTPDGDLVKFVYQQLKAIDFVTVEDGKELHIDFTSAVDI